MSNSYKKNIITLASGNSLAQVLPVAIAPILTRIYSVEDFAALALFLSVCSVLGVFSNWKYASAIVIAKSKEESSRLILLCLLLVFIFFIIVSIVLSLNILDVGTLVEENIANNWMLIPIFIAVVSLYEILSFVYTRNKLFKQLALIAVFKSAITASCNLLLYPFFNNNLLVSQLIGFAVVGAYSLIVFYKNNPVEITLIDIRETAWHYRDFPQTKLPHNFLDILNANGVIFLISYFFGQMELGLYALLFRVMLLPVTIQSYQRIKKTIILIIATTFIPYCIIFFYGGELFSFVFGEEWYIAGTYAAILTPFFLLYLPASALSHLPTAFRKLKLGFYVALCGNTISLVIYVIAGFFYDLTTAFQLISVFMTIFFLIVIIFYLLMIKTKSLALEENKL